ncbi:DUF302 domain-containing protein [Wenzhouxiangella limi]|uniref:DUF302 domain-containing protein n=1 Tax=Wenzhouxiangella limi TaxID=2707351 RepID=A0A845V2G4_9GAMM|nr:DUF302 domain-containing protein [Wenzhouxiangella limi]NDY96792.1 DUF302 domain-containing protein [Wenzhouxiangella limi]
MRYDISKTLETTPRQARERVMEVLASEGFGVLSEIDVQATMKKKLDRDMPYYTILGACNPAMAWKALEREPKIGTMLPCNVILRELESGNVEVSAVDPQASMQAVENPELGEVADEVRMRLRKVIEAV